MSVIEVTKIEAAQRQLHTAISLWFKDGDPVSIHTLVTSAYQIIHDVNHRRKGPPLLFDSDLLKDEHRKEAVSLIKKDANFFKHADYRRKNRANTTTFNPALSEGFMLFALRGLDFLGYPHGDVEAAFLAWTWLHKPHFLTAEGRKELIDPIPVEELGNARALKRSEFLDAFLGAMAARRS